MKTKETKLSTSTLKEIRNNLVKLDLSLRALIASLETIILLDVEVEEEKPELEIIPKKIVRKVSNIESKIEPEITVPKDSVRKVDLGRYLRNRNGKLEIVKMGKDGNKYILHKRENIKMAHLLPEELHINQSVEIPTKNQVYRGVIKSITNKEINKDFFFVLDDGTDKNPWVKLNSITEKVKVLDDNKGTNTKTSKGITHKT